MPVGFSVGIGVFVYNGFMVSVGSTGGCDAIPLGRPVTTGVLVESGADTFPSPTVTLHESERL